MRDLANKIPFYSRPIKLCANWFQSRKYHNMPFIVFDDSRRKQQKKNAKKHQSKKQTHTTKSHSKQQLDYHCASKAFLLIHCWHLQRRSHTDIELIFRNDQHFVIKPPATTSAAWIKLVAIQFVNNGRIIELACEACIVPLARTIHTSHSVKFKFDSMTRNSFQTIFSIEFFSVTFPLE